MWKELELGIYTEETAQKQIFICSVYHLQLFIKCSAIDNKLHSDKFT